MITVLIIVQVLPCPPAVRCSIVVKGDGRLLKVLLRGDANGRVSVFTIPEVTDSQLEQIRQVDKKFENPPSMSNSTVATFNSLLIKKRKTFISRYGFPIVQQPNRILEAHQTTTDRHFEPCGKQLNTHT